MKGLAKRATSVTPSLTLAITAQAKKLKSEGVDVVAFTAGEPDCNTPAYIVASAKEALDKGFTKYTPASGTAELRTAICEKLKRENGLDYKPEQIVVSNGAKQSIFNVLQTIVEEGDEVIIVAPFWLTYPELIKVNGGTPVTVYAKAENGFKISPEEIESAVTAKTKAIIFNSPNNPTGAVYNECELKAIMDVCVKHDLYVVSDEIYEKLIYSGKHVSMAALGEKAYERTFVINGMSKAYAMTGWRIGYVAAPDAKTAKLMGGLQSHETSNPNSIAQYASVTALSTGDDVIAEMTARFGRRQKLMWKELESVPFVDVVKGDGAFYVMVKVSALFGKNLGGSVPKTALDVANLLIEKAHVAVIPCESFGAPDYIRLSYALGEDDIVKGIKRIADFFAQAK